MKTTKTKTDQSVSRLVAALEAHERAKLARPEDNPFVDHDLKQMASAGLRKSVDKIPARNMAVAGGAGHDLEEARFEVAQADKADRSAKRMAAARARAARKAQFDKIMTSPVTPDEGRMRQAWAVMAHLFPTVVRIANSKRRWAARFLGDVLDDVAAITLENMALMLAKSDQDLAVLEVAAGQIASQQRESGLIPSDQLSESERKERKALAKGRKWLMQVANNRVMDTLIDVYFRSHNLRWENIDIVATVMATINGVGDDPMGSRFKADRAPAFMGARFQRPGGVDSALLATAINAAITERGLDRMVELLLNHTRTDGSFKWSKHAKDVFLAAPDGDGEWMWQVICQSTEGVNRDGKPWTTGRARKARGDAARQFVRNTFEWLPGFIIEVIDSFDPQAIGYAVQDGSGVRAILASDFELYYLPDEPEVRQPLRPRLKYADAGEAAQALIEHLAVLATGEDLVRSVTNE